MEEKDSPDISREEKFIRAKQKVKVWEGDYIAIHGCRPNKDALASAPHDIRTAYKLYCHYRKTLDCSRKDFSVLDVKSNNQPLRTSNYDNKNVEDSELSKMSGSEIGNKESESSETPNANATEDKAQDCETLYNSDSMVSFKEKTASKTPSSEKSDTSVWGRHLNKSTDTEFVPKGKVKEDSLYSKMAEKLRASGTVKMRTSLKKFTAGNRFRRNTLISTSEKESNVADKENVKSDDSKQIYEDIGTPFPENDSPSTSALSEESVFSSYSSVFGALGKIERKLSLLSDSLNTDSNHDSLDSENAFVRSGSDQLGSSSVLDQLNDNSPKLPFRVQRSQNIKTQPSQSVNAMSLSVVHDQQVESNVKKKSSLNRGWLARCVGTDVDSGIDPQEFNGSSDDWKMKLTDREWLGDAHVEDCIAKEENSVDSNAAGNKVYDKREKGVHNSQVVHEHEIGLVDALGNLHGKEEIEHSDYTGTLPKSKPGRRGRGGRGKRKTKSEGLTKRKQNIASEHDLEMEPDKDYENYKNDLDVFSDCPYEFHDGFQEEQEIRLRLPRKAKAESCNASYKETDDPESGDEISSSKRKREDLEELEQRGKIQSSWPPPKKIREARKPAAKTAGSRKKVDRIKNAPIPLGSDCQTVKTQQTKRRRNVNSGEANATQVRKRVRKPSNISKVAEVTGMNVDSHKSLPCIQKKRVGRPRKVRDIPVTDSNPQENVIPVVEKSLQLPTNAQIQDECLGVKEYDELEDIESNNRKAGKKYLTKEERFKRKITTGTANNNYVRINLKKKTFVRGKKYMNIGKYKRKEWKKKQLFKSAEEGNQAAIKSLTCFKCGDFGHWSKYCPGKVGDSLMPIEEYDEKESTFLSLEEAAALAQGIKPSSYAPVAKVYTNPESSEKQIQAKTFEDDNTTEDASSKKDCDERATSEADCGERVTSAADCDEGVTSAVDCNKRVTSTDESEGLIHSKEEIPENQGTISNFQEDDSLDDLFASIDENSTSELNLRNLQVPSNDVLHDKPNVDALYELENGNVGPTSDEVYETLRMFGYSSFRVGQENAIMRILSGLSTLLVLSTGSGKSLCYQLPAYLYAKHNKCITICISPLVSLMEDQVRGLPNFLRAVCLHTQQNSSQRTIALNAIRSGNVHILLVSPEAVVGCQTGGILGSLLKELPPIAFACLDEAHCVSEWSHNFRPSYLRVCQVLREKLRVRTILGLTATARHATAQSIAQHLEIKDFDHGVIRGTSVPSNLMLSVSRDEVREQALIALLQGDRFNSCDSIIIYCTRRDECERIATLIRTQLAEPSKIDVKSNMKRARALSYDAEAYHAGLSGYRRQQVQKQFMSGRLRIVVATVAFGMGIDKSDVRGIIHFNMPRNLESYVQEIGRAGRDGEEAHCHLFLDAHDGRDIQELKRHIYANSLDRHTVRKLLSQVFKPCPCIKVKSLAGDCEISPKKTDIGVNQPGSPSLPPNEYNSPEENTREDFFPVFPSSSCPKHEVAMPINNLVERLDLPEENIETLLCYLELHWSNLVKLSSHTYASCSIACYGGPRQLVVVSRRCPPLAVAIALERQKGMVMDKCNRVSFPVVDIASRMGWNSKIVKRELKALEWNTLDLPVGGKVKRSGVSVEFSDLSFHIDARGDLSDDELDQLLNALFRRIQLREKEQLRQLHYTYQLLHSASHKSILLCCDDVDLNRSSRLREGLSSYFAKEGRTLSDVRIEEQVYLNPDTESYVRSSVRSVLSTHSDHQWTGRAMARVFHGISSPNFPAEVWGRVRRIWRLHLNVEFNLLVRVATQEILRCK